MKKEHITLRIDGRLFGRVKATANRHGMTVSNFVRGVLHEKVDRDLLNPQLPLTRNELVKKIRPVFEEMLISLLGLEELVIRGFMDPIVSKNATEDTKVGVLKSAGANSRQRAKEILDEHEWE